MLVARGFVVESAGTLAIVHPFVRDLVEASTPAEARKALHMRALGNAAEVDAPLEVRAHHAYGAGETWSAMVLLERMGDRAALRGDLETAVLGYQRGIELARREVLESGDVSLDEALASMSRRLGTVLARRGDVTGAEGVLREALEYSKPSSVQRAQILVSLARVSAERNRSRESYRQLGQALELAYREDSVPAQIDVQVALAELRRGERDSKGAISALKAVVELLDKQGGDAPRRATTLLDLADTYIDDSDLANAEATLRKATRVAEDSKIPYPNARLAAARARLAQARATIRRR